VKPMRLAAFILACVATAGLADAQSVKPRRPQPPPDPSVQVDKYDDALGGLSRVLGGAHYLRILCSGRGDQTWRTQMGKLMDLEGVPGTPRRALMAQEFNNGYRDQEVQFSSCTPAAQAAEQALKGKGARYSTALAARYR
jgi:uncharacterized protein (TIGR02301 family)